MIDFFISCFRAFRIGSWPIIILMMIRAGAALSFHLRHYAFDNFCDETLRHAQNFVSENQNYVSWCEDWWWHPLGAAIRITIGVIWGLLLWWMCGFYVSKSRSSYLFTAIFTTTVSAFYLIWQVLEPFKFFIWRQCLFYDDPEYKTICDQQLGTLGDPRFFAPVALCLTLWVLYIFHKRIQNQS